MARRPPHGQGHPPDEKRHTHCQGQLNGQGKRFARVGHRFFEGRCIRNHPAQHGEVEEAVDISCHRELSGALAGGQCSVYEELGPREITPPEAAGNDHSQNGDGDPFSCPVIAGDAASGNDECFAQRNKHEQAVSLAKVIRSQIPTFVLATDHAGQNIGHDGDSPEDILRGAPCDRADNHGRKSAQRQEGEAAHIGLL